MKRSHTATTLEQAIEANFESQAHFAEQCGLDRSKVNRDITGRSAHMPDERLTLYIKALPTDSKVAILRARMLDLLPEDLHEDLVYQRTGTSSMVSEGLPSFPPISLTPEIRSALEWLGEELTRCPELASPVLTIIERLGWERPDPEKEKVRYE